MNGFELLDHVKKAASVDEILLTVEGKTAAEIQSKRGNVIEKLWDVIIKFGYCTHLPNDTYDHYEGNMNTCKLKKVENLDQYLRQLSVFSKGKGGSSDITLCDSVTGKWVFMTSKYYLDDSKKSIDKYDVEKILAITKEHSHRYKEYDIFLLVNNKQKVLDLIQSSHATSDYIKDNIHHVLGMEDLALCFSKFKQAILEVDVRDIDRVFNNAKIPLTLRFHQDLLTHQQMRRIAQGEKHLLLGAKARSGKTYCVGGLFVKYLKSHGSLNALVVTPAPTETLSQFTDDLFRKFRDFIDVHVLEITRGADFSKMTTPNATAHKNNIVIVSKQLLDDYVLEKRIVALQNLNLDFIVFDENHFHGTTLMSKHILSSYSVAKTVKLYLTATYAKPLREWHVPHHCQFFWDIEDEQLCKQRNVAALMEKHGAEDVSLFLPPDHCDPVLSPYDRMPDLHIITNMMDAERYQYIKDRIHDTSFGFSNGTLFSTTKDGANFNYTEEVDLMLRLISGKGKVDEAHDPVRDTKCVFERIKKISNMHDSRTKLNNGDFTSQLWFLPYGKDMLIDRVSVCLKDRMMKNRVFSQYEIMIVNSKRDFKLKDIKMEIKNRELKAKQEGKTGLILLAGNQLTLGITLPFVDIVMLLNDVVSSDKIVQMMYRCMTETVHDPTMAVLNNKPKKIGFVVDMNVSRVLNTLLNYNIREKGLHVEQRIEYIVENHLINIDDDLFHDKENKTPLVKKLIEIWKSDPTNNLRTLLKRIEDNVIEVDDRDQTLINQHFSLCGKDDRPNQVLSFDEDCPEPLPTGREIEAQPTGEDGNPIPPEGDEKEKPENVSLAKDVLPYILPLNILLTMKDTNHDILAMMKTVKENPELLAVFNDQCYIWWNKRNMMPILENMIVKYVQRNTYLYDIAVQFKMSMQSMIDRPRELLELIDSCLKPKQKEKQENGEVFTPMELILEMLGNLDNHYKTKHSTSIFSNPYLRWGDVMGSGMGNFSVGVFLKLMEGLAQMIPDERDRKRHILENMIYMAEANKKNAFVSRQIFDVEGQYKLNLFEGDALAWDPLAEWNLPTKFDVVLGNPPYNKGGIRSHTQKQLGEKTETIWTKFVKKAMEWLREGEDAYLVCIHPLTWLKKSNPLHPVLLEKHVVWLKLWDNIKSLATIQGKIPISLYILHNVKNSECWKTQIISEIQSKKIKTSSWVYLNADHSIPLAYHSVFEKLGRFIEERGLQLEYNTKTVKATGGRMPLPAVVSLEDGWAVDTYTIKEGIAVKKAAEVHPDAKKPKLILANKAGFAGAYVDEGKLSLTCNHKYYILGDRLEMLREVLSYKFAGMVCHYTKYGQDFLDVNAFKYIPDVRKLGEVEVTEARLYEWIGLTADEVSAISAAV